MGGYEVLPPQPDINTLPAPRYYSSTSQHDCECEADRLLEPSPYVSRAHTPSQSQANLLRIHDYTPYRSRMSKEGSRSASPQRYDGSTKANSLRAESPARPDTNKTAVLESYEMRGKSRSPSPHPGSSGSDELKMVNEKNDSDEDVIEYPHGAKLAIISASLCLAVFLMALDNTIIATAIPKITDQFKSLDDVGWYASSYLLTTCALQLFFGKLYTFYSIKLVFLISIGIFEVGSAICGAAPSSVALIIGRAIAGVGSAGLFSGALVIIAYTVPMAKRPAYTGIIGAMASTSFPAIQRATS